MEIGNLGIKSWLYNLTTPCLNSLILKKRIVILALHVSHCYQSKWNMEILWRTSNCVSVLDVLLLKTPRSPAGYSAMPRSPTPPSMDLVTYLNLLSHTRIPVRHISMDLVFRDTGMLNCVSSFIHLTEKIKTCEKGWLCQMQSGEGRVGDA